MTSVNNKPQFGEWYRSQYASHDNPHRDGRYVRTITRRGRMNPGVYYELTDGCGAFWETPAHAVIIADSQPPATGDGEPMTRKPSQDPALNDLLDAFVLADSALSVAYSYENEARAMQARRAVHAYLRDAKLAARKGHVSHDFVSAAVQEAVNAERKACAKIAEDERDIESDHENHSGGIGSAACQRTAQRIRSRSLVTAEMLQEKT